MINSDQQAHGAETTSDSDNKVTISVGGEDSICNPTVISVNNNALVTPSSIQTSSDQKRTLVIFDNYRSNIVISGERHEQRQIQVNGNRITRLCGSI
jgi:hypothetical protein